MEETIAHFLKKPKTVRSIYFIGCMIASCCLGIIGEYSIINRDNNPIIETPKKPMPLAYRYKTQSIINPVDLLPAEMAESTPETTELVNTSNNSQSIVPTNTQAFVASKTGKKYYPAGCAGINRIKSENRVYFSSEKDAQEKGYTRTTTCN